MKAAARQRPSPGFCRRPPRPRPRARTLITTRRARAAPDNNRRGETIADRGGRPTGSLTGCQRPPSPSYTTSHPATRTSRELSAEDIGRIADAYHAWRGEDADFKPYEDTPASPGFSYEDVPGFRAATDLDAIRDHNHVLIPGQYIGGEPVKGGREPLDEKIARLTAGIGGWLYRPPGLRR